MEYWNVQPNEPLSLWMGQFNMHQLLVGVEKMWFSHVFCMRMCEAVGSSRYYLPRGRWTLYYQSDHRSPQFSRYYRLLEMFEDYNETL